MWISLLINCNLECFEPLINENENETSEWMSEWEFKVCLRAAVQIAAVFCKKRTFQRCFNPPYEKNLRNPVAQLRPPWEGLVRVRRLTQRASPWMNRKAFTNCDVKIFYDTTFHWIHTNDWPEREKKIHWSGCEKQQQQSLECTNLIYLRMFPISGRDFH